MEYLDHLVKFLQDTPWWSIFTAVVALASAVAAVTPTPAKDSPWSKLYIFIDALAINIGRAKQEAKDSTEK